MNALLNEVIVKTAADNEDLPSEKVELVVNSKRVENFNRDNCTIFQAQKYRKLLQRCANYLASIWSERWYGNP